MKAQAKAQNEKPQKFPDIENFTSKKRQLENKMTRIRTATKVLLRFSRKSPSYPKPKHATDYQSWRRDLVQIAQDAEHCLKEELNPVDPAKEPLRSDMFISKGKKSHIVVEIMMLKWSNPESPDHKPYPNNTPELFFSGLQIRENDVRK
jgi:hypothetical protein